MPFWTEILPPRQAEPGISDRRHRVVRRLLDSAVWWPALAALILALSGLAMVASQESSSSPAPIVRDAVAPVTNRPGLVDINTATHAELETLPGIGASRAEAIVQLRAQQPFRSLTDLVDRGILSPAQLTALRDLAAIYVATR